MASVDSLRGHLDEELRNASPRLKEIAETTFKKVTEGDSMPVDLCKFVWAEVRALCTREQLPEALIIWKKLTTRIAEGSFQTSVQEQRDRISAKKMSTEILRAYEVIRKNGRGVVYLGSARTQPGNPYFEGARELGREVYLLLRSTSWSGAGPGQMEAPLLGAKEAGGRVAGVKIIINDERAAFEQSVTSALDPENVALCDYFGPRKIGLADAAMREQESDRTAIIATPGGWGTRDEVFEYLVLKQLKKMGTKHPVPLIIKNQNHFFDKMLEDNDRMLREGMISEDDLKLFSVCDSNRCVLDTLADFYAIPEEERGYKLRELAY